MGSFLDGYLPTSKRGVITRARGRRIDAIDGRPAALVYDQWSGGAITHKLQQNATVLTETALKPLARSVPIGARLTRRILAHPSEVSAESRPLRHNPSFPQDRSAVSDAESKTEPVVDRDRRRCGRSESFRHQIGNSTCVPLEFYGLCTTRAPPGYGNRSGSLENRRVTLL